MLLELHLLVLLLLGQELRLEVVLLICHDHALGLTLVRLGPLLYFRLSYGLLPEGCWINQLTQVLICRVDLCGQLLGSKGRGRAGLAAQLVVSIDLALGQSPAHGNVQRAARLLASLAATVLRPRA